MLLPLGNWTKKLTTSFQVLETEGKLDFLCLEFPGDFGFQN